MFPCPGKQESWKTGKANHETTFARILGLWSAPPPRHLLHLKADHHFGESQGNGWFATCRFWTCLSNRQPPLKMRPNSHDPGQAWLIHRQQERSCLREVSRSGGNGHCCGYLWRWRDTPTAAATASAAEDRSEPCQSHPISKRNLSV
jgi:hypothetical protein